MLSILVFITLARGPIYGVNYSEHAHGHRNAVPGLSEKIDKLEQEKFHLADKRSALLRVQAQNIPENSSFINIKLNVLMKRRQDLIEEYEAANAQLARTLSDVDRVRLERQLRDLERQITKIEAELADLDQPPIDLRTPGSSGLTAASPLMPSQRRHLQQEYNELETTYDSLTRAISALDTDISRTTEAFSKQPLLERRDERVAERDQIVSRMAQIEAVLSQ